MNDYPDHETIPDWASLDRLMTMLHKQNPRGLSDPNVLLILDLPDGWNVPSNWLPRIQRAIFDRRQEFTYPDERSYMYQAVEEAWKHDGVPYTADPVTRTLKRTTSEDRMYVRLTPSELVGLLRAFTVDVVVAYDSQFDALTLVYPPDC